jgi:hypothetical protein
MPLAYQWIRSLAHHTISSQYGGKDWYELAERQGGQCNSRQRSQYDGRLCFMKTIWAQVTSSVDSTLQRRFRPPIVSRVSEGDWEQTR